MVDLLEQVKATAGVTQSDIDFTCSGSSDFIAGQAFSFVMTIDAVGPVPPIAESHVEMDGAFALYEAWVKIQTGKADTALVYGYSRSSGSSLRDVLATQLDPYYVAPLWPDAFAVEALAARSMLESGVCTLDSLAERASRSRRHAAANPNAVRTEQRTAAEIMAESPLADPLRPSDIPVTADGGCAVILAAGDAARRLTDRPAWIRGIDHRIDAHTFGVRDLGTAPSAGLAAAKAGAGDDKLDFVECYAPYTTSEAVLMNEFGLGDADADGSTVINPSGGALAGDCMMASGLIRFAEAASRISAGDGDRALAHAGAGPLLQQNLVAVLEGD